MIAYLKNEIKKQKKEVELAEEKCKELRRDCRHEVETTEAKYAKLLQTVQDELAEEKLKTEELQAEHLKLKEFARVRQQITQELAALKVENVEVRQSYEAEMERRETKFYEEKVRMRLESEAEINALAERAHASAVAGLDETTRNTYKENVRLEKELELNKSEAERLGTENAALEAEVADLRATTAESEAAMVEKVKDAVEACQTADILAEKVASLEKALGHCVREFEHERGLLVARAEAERGGDSKEIQSLKKALELKTAETRRVRHLARNILQQRSDIEVFFLDSLHRVRKEILESRQSFERESKLSYRHQMAQAATGAAVLPPIQTFGGGEASTNSIGMSFAAAVELPDDWNELDPRDLTWEQRERVLRLIFNRMTESKRTAVEAKAKAAAEAELARAAEPIPAESIRSLPISLSQFTITAAPDALPALTTGAPASRAELEEPVTEQSGSFFLTEGGGAANGADGVSVA